MPDNFDHAANAPAGLKIGVIVNNVGGYSRGVIRGIASFAFTSGWDCRVEGVNDHQLEKRLRTFDGLIVQAGTAETVRLIKRLRRPVVNVSSARSQRGVASVVSDDAAVGRLGADHFLRLGFRRLAFFAPDDREFAALRAGGFTARAAEAGVPVTRTASAGDLADLVRRHALDSHVPLAVMACNDRAALAALETCRATGAAVPEQVAVLGVDNDELAQSLARPALSTINTARERIGFEAASLLQELIAGRRPEPLVRLVPPRGVIARRSTDAAAVGDADVAAAVRYVYANAGRPIGVDDVARAGAVSRRQMERRFRAALGRSVHDEITRCRLDRVKQLLLETDLTLPQVAAAGGFRSANYLGTVFRRHVGQTPASFRGLR
ncbi:MAG: substrate-binding domain-containing protein [Phycisphaerae bacterium]